MNQTGLQERIAALEAELAAVRTEFSTYSGRLSHDLRGIFRNIDGFASALREQASGRWSEKEARYVERIEAGARRGDGVVRDLTALSAAAAAPMQPYPMDVAALVRQSIQDLVPGLQDRAVEWQLADGPGPRIAADPGLLRLAVDHLLANALKFSRGRAPARIRVDVDEAAPGECAIVVSDNGVGFDAAYGDRLFQAFERLHLPSEFEGNGLGLALVKTVAQRHGGRVRAEALPEGGARFTLVLPRGNAEAAAPAPRPAASEGAAPARLRILVVDDEPMVLATMRTMLEREGHEVVAAVGGAAGRQALGRAAPDAGRFHFVVTDWLMPQVTGEQVVQAAQACDPAPRIIVLTGQRPDLHAGHAMPAGVDLVLEKPVRPLHLRRALEALR